MNLYPTLDLTELTASLSRKTFTAMMKVRTVTQTVTGSFTRSPGPAPNLHQVQVRFNSSLDLYGIPPQNYKEVGVKNNFEIIIDLSLEGAKQ